MPRVNRLSFPITSLGHGRRLAVWFQGCPLACRGCLARDTWDGEQGGRVTVAELLEVWGSALEDGADGLTVSGGEPLAQPEALAEFLHGAHLLRAGLDREVDFLVYTGYEPAEISGAAEAALRHADAVITGRFDVTRPTRLIWRGSADQALTPRTGLGHRRYDPHLDHEPEHTPMQAGVDEEHLWFAGVPGRGDLPRLERELAARGITFEGVTWRP